MPLTLPMKVATPTLFFCLGLARGWLPRPQVRECALINTGTREEFLEGSRDGALPVLATKGLFAREGCPVKIQTGGMPRIV